LDEVEVVEVGRNTAGSAEVAGLSTDEIMALLRAY